MNDDVGIIFGAFMTIFVIFVILFFVVKSNAEQQQKINETLTKDELIAKQNVISKIEYEGHSYLIMNRSKYQNGICHDENCNCRSK